MKVTCWGKTYDVTIQESKYVNNGNFALSLLCDDGPFAVITVNLNETLPEKFAYVDTNNCPWAEEFIKENNLGKFLGVHGYSGYCSYPLYRFY